MSKKALFSFIISFILLIAVIVIDRVSFNRMRAYTVSVDHTREVITAFSELSNHLKSAETYSEKYAHIGNENFYDLYKEEALKVKDEVARLSALIKDNPVQVKRADSVNRIITRQWDAMITYNISELILMGEGKRLKELFTMHAVINNGIEHEKILLEARKKDLRNFTRINSFLSALFSFIAITIILITFLSNLAATRKRKWLEGFLESVLNTSKNGIVSYKPIVEDGKITDLKVEFANQPIRELLGVEPAEVVGKQLSQFPSYVRQAGLLERFIRAAETGEPDEFENYYNNKGIERWIHISLATREDGLTATFHDITRIKQFEEELKKNITQLQNSNSELEQYAYVASHDLQEPLRKIRIFASQMKDATEGKLDEKSGFYLDKIMSSAARMSNLIRDILGFSSLKKENAFSKTNLNEIIRHCLQDLEMAIAQKNGEVIIDELPELEAIPLQMNQLFYNLINNALKFAKADVKPVIRIHSELLKPHEVVQYKTLNTQLKYCEITVSDNGIGFDNSFSTQIFGLFKRLGNKQTYGGSGIGLALCRKVVENHNGIIYAHSKEGEGATFHIILPLEQQHAKSLPARESGKSNFTEI
jgi:PAS domain S-box-containing protein